MGFWNPGQFAGGFFAPSSLPILDQLSASAAVAFSTRKVRAAYSGSAIRVRRSSDDAEQDIGFVSGELDTAALETFVGANDGFVVTWYDQSGNNRDATQATAANQPRIVNSGSLQTLTNGKPAVKIINGSSTYVAASFSLSQPITESVIAKRDGAIGGSAEVLTGGSSFTCSVSTKDTSGYFEGYSGANLVSTTVVPEVTYGTVYVFNGASSKIYQEGTEIASGDMGSNGIATPFEIGSWSGGSNGGNYSVSEVLLFGSVLSTTDRQKIENSQSFFLT